MEAGRYEEKLLEAACVGDEDAVSKLLLEKGVNVNAQNKMNGWTALHWAAKRGHANIVSYLLRSGADTSVATRKGETAAALSDQEDIVRLLGGSFMMHNSDEKLPIMPNYLAYPTLNYKVDIDGHMSSSSKPVVNGSPMLPVSSGYSSPAQHTIQNEEIVLKARIAHTSDPDFIEVELPCLDLTYSRLLRVCCEELAIDPTHVLKVRKLPDTVIRKDKDVRRLCNFQEIEVVLSNQKNLDAKFSISPFPHTSPSPRSTFSNCTILY